MFTVPFYVVQWSRHCGVNNFQLSKIFTHLMINNAYLFCTTVYQLATVYQLSIIIINRLSPVHFYKWYIHFVMKQNTFWGIFNYCMSQRTKEITKANVQIYKHIQASEMRMAN